MLCCAAMHAHSSAYRRLSHALNQADGMEQRGCEQTTQGTLRVCPSLKAKDGCARTRPALVVGRGRLGPLRGGQGDWVGSEKGRHTHRQRRTPTWEGMNIGHCFFLFLFPLSCVTCLVSLPFSGVGNCDKLDIGGIDTKDMLAPCLYTKKKGSGFEGG